MNQKEKALERNIMLAMAKIRVGERFGTWDIIAHGPSLSEHADAVSITVKRVLTGAVGVRGRKLEEGFTGTTHYYVWRQLESTLRPTEDAHLHEEISDGTLFLHQHPDGLRVCHTCSQVIPKTHGFYWKRQEFSEEGVTGEAIFFHGGLCLEQYYWRENQKKGEGKSVLQNGAGKLSS